MSVALFDYIFDTLDLNYLQDFAHIFIICSDTCSVSDNILNSFVQSTDLERICRGGKFIIRVANDVQWGFILSFIATKLRPEIFSHRPEVLSRSLGISNVKLLPTPDRLLEARPPPGPEARPEQKKPRDLFDKIYQESLEKYVEAILCQQIRATKLKSARAQLKNIVDGIIIATNKKAGIQVTFSSDEITDAILSDLENHGIISTSMASVSYYDEWIESFFGKRRTKVFNPKHRGGDEPRPGKRAEDPMEGYLLDIIMECMRDERIGRVKTVSELFHNVSLMVNSRNPNAGGKSDETIKRVFSEILIKYFYVEEGKDIEAVSQNPNSFYTTKIYKNF